MDLSAIITKTRQAYKAMGVSYTEIYTPFHEMITYPTLLEHIKKSIGTMSGKRILDIGCRNGGLMDLLSENGAVPVGIEISEDAVQTTQEKGYEAHQASMHHMPILEDGEFDCIVSSFALNYLPAKGQQKTFKEMFRVLKPHGVVIFSCMHPYKVYSREHKNYFKADTVFQEDLLGQTVTLYVYPLMQTLNMMGAVGFSHVQAFDDMSILEKIPVILETLPEGPEKDYLESLKTNPYGLFIVAQKK